jgi:hypothetical protein
VTQHLVVSGFFYVEDLALQRQNGLETTIASLLGGTAGGLTLDQIDLAPIGVAFGAISELAGKTSAVERAFASREIAGLSRGFARACSFNGFVDNAASDSRILLKERA